MERRAPIPVVIVRVVIALVLLALLAVVARQWPGISLLVVYLIVCVILVVRYARQVFFAPGSAAGWSTALIDLASAHLSADPPLTRWRRRLSAALLIVSRALLWPNHAVIAFLGRFSVRRNAAGQWVPRRHRPTTLFRINYLLSGALFALLPVGVLWLSVTGRAGEPLAVALFSVLVVSVFARHFAMLIFPHDLKTTMRRTPGDPRVYFVAYLLIDTFAFAVLVQFLAFHTGAALADIAGFRRAIQDVLSVSEARALAQDLMQLFDAELSQIGAGVLRVLGQVTPIAAFEMTCSGLVYLNILRMLFPLHSWKQTDEDLKYIARVLFIGGNVEEARGFLAKVKSYDVEAAQLDSWLSANQNDFKAAAKKMRWAHARNAMPEDQDSIFMDIVGPLILVPSSGLDFGQAIDFALGNDVSDTILAVLLLFGQSGERVNPGAVLDIIQAKGRVDAYPLSVASLELGCGNRQDARARLDNYAADDVVSRCVALLLKEIVASPDALPAPSIVQAAEEAANAIDAVEIEGMTLARQLALLSVLICFRGAVACRDEASPALAALTSKILANIREFHPSYREHVTLLENYGRITETQAKRRVQAAQPA